MDPLPFFWFAITVVYVQAATVNKRLVRQKQIAIREKPIPFARVVSLPSDLLIYLLLINYMLRLFRSVT